MIRTTSATTSRRPRGTEVRRGGWARRRRQLAAVVTVIAPVTGSFSCSTRSPRRFGRRAIGRGKRRGLRIGRRFVRDTKPNRRRQSRASVRHPPSDAGPDSQTVTGLSYTTAASDIEALFAKAQTADAALIKASQVRQVQLDGSTVGAVAIFTVPPELTQSEIFQNQYLTQLLRALMAKPTTPRFVRIDGHSVAMITGRLGLPGLVRWRQGDLVPQQQAPGRSSSRPRRRGWSVSPPPICTSAPAADSARKSLWEEADLTPGDGVPGVVTWATCIASALIPT